MIRQDRSTTSGALTGVFLAGVMVLAGGISHADKNVRKTHNKQVKLAQGDNAPIESLRVTRGGQITLPLDNVTRIIPANDDVARGRFVEGKAVIEGVTSGVTTVVVQQGSPKTGDAKIQKYEVEVLPATATPPAPVENTTPAPAPVAVAPVEPPVAEIPAPAPAPLPEPAPVSVIPVPAPAPAPAPEAPVTVAAITPGNSGATEPVSNNKLNISLGVEPAEDNPSQALFTITYGNPTDKDANGVVIKYTLDDMVSYVTASATGGARYDAAAREIAWNVGDLPAGTVDKKISFRIAAISPDVDKFYSAATMESDGGLNLASNQIEYSFNPTPLLTVFAIPDRIIEGKNSVQFNDVNGAEYRAAIERLRKMGLLMGNSPGQFVPNAITQRAEYTVMILRGLNLKDLRDMSAIKFVLSRRATVNIAIRNSANKVVATLIRNTQFDAGERTVVWDGTTTTGQAPAGRYSYTCTARDAKGVTTTLRGYITIVAQTPVDTTGTSSFIDVKPGSWYSGYLANAERQGLVKGYPSKEFKPTVPINRVEATAVVVRAIGLEDMAKNNKGREAGFLDDHMIPDWASGYVYVASTIAKTNTGKLIVGYPSNMYMPLNPMRRDEAALIIQRLVDKETNRVIVVSGQLVPGAVVTINSHKVIAKDDGSFTFTIHQNSTEPTSVAVIDRH